MSEQKDCKLLTTENRGEKMRQGRDWRKSRQGWHLPVNTADRPPSFNAPHRWLPASKWQTVLPFQRH